MRVIRLALLLHALGVTVAYSQAMPQGRPPADGAGMPDQIPQLELTAKVVGQCYESGTNLRLSLNLQFKNSGGKAVILYRESSVIGRYFVSRNLESAARKKYEMNVSPMKTLLGSKLRFDPPTHDQFVQIKPGVSHDVEVTLYLGVNNGRDGNRDYLPPGEHFLQVNVWTWYHQPHFITSYRKQWKQRGYLWSDSLVSLPMPFAVRPEPIISQCAK